MALDVSMLYGEMVASALAHIGIVFAIFMLIKAIPGLTDLYRSLVFIGCCTLLSWIVQALLLAVLQSSSCGGIKSYGGVAIGASIAAVITLVMIAIPLFIEPLRLVVSHLFIEHQPLVNAIVAQQEEIVVDAANNINQAEQTAQPQPTAQTQQSGGGLRPDDYDSQLFKEMSLGAGFWGAFAGAYGVGVGSLWGARCS
jgi:hypothetical protein